jgi:hypothetical protein
MALRVAALNHGTFQLRMPGQEAQQVLRKIRDWAGEVGEINVTEDAHPLVSIQITGVDLEPVLVAHSNSAPVEGVPMQGATRPPTAERL